MIEAIKEIGKWQIVFTVWHRHIILRKPIKTAVSLYPSLFVIPCPDTESNSSGHSALDAESIAAGHSEPVSESNVTLSPFLPFTQSQNVGEDRGEGVKNE